MPPPVPVPPIADRPITGRPIPWPDGVEQAFMEEPITTEPMFTPVRGVEVREMSMAGVGGPHPGMTAAAVRPAGGAALLRGAAVPVPGTRRAAVPVRGTGNGRFFVNPETPGNSFRPGEAEGRALKNRFSASAFHDRHLLRRGPCDRFRSEWENRRSPFSLPTATVSPVRVLANRKAAGQITP